MNFSQLIESRYSVRSFTDKEIESEKIEKILSAAMVAPTAKNLQPQRIYVLKSVEALEKISSVCKFIFGAPIVFLVTANLQEAWENPLSSDYFSGEIDCSIVCTHMMLQAWEQGIGSCWVGYFDREKVEKAFNLPQNEKLIAIMPMGYPSDTAKPSPMHSISKETGEIVKYI